MAGLPLRSLLTPRAPRSKNVAASAPTTAPAPRECSTGTAARCSPSAPPSARSRSHGGSSRGNGVKRTESTEGNSGSLSSSSPPPLSIHAHSAEGETSPPRRPRSESRRAPRWRRREPPQSMSRRCVTDGSVMNQHSKRCLHARSHAYCAPPPDGHAYCAPPPDGHASSRSAREAAWLATAGGRPSKRRRSSSHEGASVSALAEMGFENASTVLEPATPLVNCPVGGRENAAGLYTHIKINGGRTTESNNTQPNKGSPSLRVGVFQCPCLCWFAVSFPRFGLLPPFISNFNL